MLRLQIEQKKIDMWSDAARQASADARKKASGHNAGQGNRKVAKHVADQHKSVAGGAIKGAGAGAVVGAAIGAAALNRYGGARIGAKLGAVAGAKAGALVGGVYRYATNKKGK